MAIYEIAYSLRMPLYKLKEEMPYDELVGWFQYFKRRPVGWREDDRAFKFLQTQGVKGAPGDTFPSLKQIYSSGAGSVDDDGMCTSLAGTQLLAMLQNASGGDKLDFGGDS